jgi:hypothetical protein
MLQQGLHSRSSRNGLEYVTGQIQMWLFAQLRQTGMAVARPSSGRNTPQTNSKPGRVRSLWGQPLN